MTGCIGDNHPNENETNFETRLDLTHDSGHGR
jgi:hypothetical protein